MLLILLCGCMWVLVFLRHEDYFGALGSLLASGSLFREMSRNNLKKLAEEEEKSVSYAEGS